MAIFESVLVYNCASWVAAQLAWYSNSPGNSWHNLTTLRVLMLAEVDAHVDGLITRTGSNEAFIQAIRVVIQHVFPDAFHATPNSFFVGLDPVEPTESHYRTVSLAREHRLHNRTYVHDTICAITRVIPSPPSKTPSVSSRTTCPVQLIT